jgi:hypothetical protein
MLEITSSVAEAVDNIPEAFTVLYPLVLAITKEVVANLFVASPKFAVGAIGEPENVGDSENTRFPVPVSSLKEDK